jgi:hypothetical protein
MKSMVNHPNRRKTIPTTITNPDDALNRLLRSTCIKLGAREIVLRYLPQPSTVRWFATALIVPHRVVDKLKADIREEREIIFSLAELNSYNDMPIARGEGGTVTDAIAAMRPLTWKAPT